MNNQYKIFNKTLLRIIVLFIFVLYGTITKSQTYVAKNPLCYGEPIELQCPFLSGGCGGAQSTYRWENFSGSWQSNLANPVINVGDVGYASDRFYLSVQYPSPPGGFSGGRVTVVVRSQMLVNGNVTPISCANDSTGAITLNVSGGSPPYVDYLWSNGATTKDVFNLSEDDYSITVTDSKGCRNVDFQPNTFTVDAPDTPLTVTPYIDNVTCLGRCDGYIDVSTTSGGDYVTGGQPPYTYLWGDGSTEDYKFSVCPGVYYLTVTDASNCSTSVEIAVGTVTPMLLSSEIISTTCFGGDDGSINLTVTNGTPDYTFIWSSDATTEDVTNLSAGIYSVTVEDIQGCLAHSSFLVNESPQISITDVIIPPTCKGSDDGSIIIEPSQGVAPYTYVWSTGETTQDIDSLSGGWYYVTVTDANNCTVTEGFEVVEAFYPLVIFLYPVDESCYQACDGIIYASAYAGGTPPYTFLWSNGATDDTLYNLCAGAYFVTITDCLGCTATTDVIVGTKPELIVSSTVQSTYCDEGILGSIQTNVTGGIPPYTYLWSNGATTPHLDSLIGGIYSLTVTDDIGCTKQLEEEVDVIGEEFAALLIKNNLWCGIEGSGSIHIYPSPVGKYTYLWNDGNTQQFRMGLNSGNYSVTISNSCGIEVEKITTILK